MLSTCNQTLTLANKTQVFRCKWQFNMTRSFLYISHRSRIIIKSWCIPPLSKSPSTLITIPNRNILRYSPVSPFTLLYVVHALPPILYQEVFTSYQLEFPSSQNINRSDITCTTVYFFIKEEILTRKVSILNNWENSLSFIVTKFMDKIGLCFNSGK